MVINTADINNKEIAYGKNGQISPIYLFTDSKKNDFFERREYARSPVVQKINFLKTVFDDIEKKKKKLFLYFLNLNIYLFF